MNPNNLVCRTCLGIISEGKLAHSIDEENGIIRNVRNIREMIVFCVPEMDIYISVNPVICDSCLRGLVPIYNYKVRCMRVENAIRSYIVANNVMEGSCVNLNNVVRQQIVEALKKKNWSPSMIKEYVEKHLCAAQDPANRPKVTSDVFQNMAQKFNAPRIMNNTGPRLPGMEMSSPALNNMPMHASFNASIPSVTDPPPEAIFRPPTTQYLSVSRNLMPPKPVTPLTQPQIETNYSNTFPMSTIENFPAPPPPSAPSFVQAPVFLPPIVTSETSRDQHQNVFLNTLQLVSTANGGREEAILLQKNDKPKRRPRPRKTKGTQNVIPPKSDHPLRKSVSKSVESAPESVASPLSRPGRLSPTTGIFREYEIEEVVKETGLRNVRKSASIQEENKSKEVSKSDEIIILDDDSEIVKEKGNDGELSVINSSEGDGNVVADKKKQGASTMSKKMVIKLPMIDKETLKRKLKPEDVIDEIRSKCRKLVVRLNPNLPYLHKNKRLVVNLRKKTFLCCDFCTYTSLSNKALNQHYLTHHKVCSRCQNKFYSPALLTQHLNQVHPFEVRQVLKRYEKENLEGYCYLCNYTGLSETDLRDHRLRVHVRCDTKGMYKCPYLSCKLELAMAHDMAVHIEKKHDKDRNMQCPLCNFSGSSVSALKIHVATHSLTKLKCPVCNYWTKTAFTLKMHIKRKHPIPENEHTTGMVFTELEDCHTDETSDYRVTLSNLLSRTPETRLNTSSSGSARKLDEYEFAGPSLTEMLCAQEMSIENPDQDECTIVSDVGDFPGPQKKRSRLGPKSKIAKKKVKKVQKSNVVDDPEDCIIIPEVIPTVDLSDDEDCVVVCQDVAVVTESSTQTSAVNVDVSGNQKRQDSKICPIIENIPPQGTTSETETSSEFSAIPRDMLTGIAVTPDKENESVDKTVNSETVVVNSAYLKNDNSNKEQNISKENAVTEGTRLVDAHNQKSLQSTSSDDSSGRETSTKDNASTVSKTNESNCNADECAKNTSEKPRELSEETSSTQEKSNMEDKNPTSTNKPKKSSAMSNKSTRCGDKEKEMVGGFETDLIQLLNDHYSDTTKDSEPAKLESVLIDSSDEDSNDCTFVSETDTQVNKAIESISKKIDDPFDLDVDENILLTKKDGSQVLEGSGQVDNSEVSQKKLNTSSKDKRLATDVPSSAAPEESDIGKENSETDKGLEVSEKENLKEQCDNQAGKDASPTESGDSDDKMLSENSELSKDTADIALNDISEIVHSDSEVENIQTSENNQKSCNKEKNTNNLNSGCEGSKEPFEPVPDSDALNFDSKMDSENTDKCKDKDNDEKKNDSDILNSSTEMESEHNTEPDKSPKDSDPKKDITEILNNDSDVLCKNIKNFKSAENSPDILNISSEIKDFENNSSKNTSCSEKVSENSSASVEENSETLTLTSELEDNVNGREIVNEEATKTDSDISNDAVKHSDTLKDNNKSDDAPVISDNSDLIQNTVDEKKDDSKCVQKDKDILRHVGSCDLTASEEILALADFDAEPKDACPDDDNSSEPISNSENCKKDSKGEKISDNTSMIANPENVILDLELKIPKD